MAVVRPKAPVVPRVTAIAPQPAFNVVKAPGGSYHVYPDGHRVFVSASPTVSGGVGAGIKAPPKGSFGAIQKPLAAPGWTGSSNAASQAAAQPTEDFTPDAQYYADSAADLKARSDKLSSLTSEGAGDETNYREALRRFREQQPKQLRSNLVSANKQGLAQSTVRSEGDADIAIQNQRQEADMGGAYGERQAAREAAKRALEQGATIEEATRLAEAADRKVNYFTERANEGSLAPAAVAAPKAQVAKAKAKAKLPAGTKTVVKNGKVYHYSPGRKPVYVRPASKSR